MAKKKIDTPRSFAHDSNARNSSKLITLRMAHGAAGYGLYFMLLERLRDASGYVEKLDYQVLAYDLRETPEMIRSVIEDFGLFTITPDGTSFYSETLTSRLSAQYVTAAPSEPAAPSENSELSEVSEISEYSESSELSETPAPTIWDLIKAASCDNEWLDEVSDDFDLDKGFLSEMLRSDFYDFCHEAPERYKTVDNIKEAFCQWLVPHV